MSRVSVERWQCDVCLKDGGVVDRNATIPFRWLSIEARVGTPQIQAEQLRGRLLHMCDGCSETFLFHSAKGAAEDIERLRSLWKRERGEAYRLDDLVGSCVVEVDPLGSQRAAAQKTTPK